MKITKQRLNILYTALIILCIICIYPVCKYTYDNDIILGLQLIIVVIGIFTGLLLLLNVRL